MIGLLIKIIKIGETNIFITGIEVNVFPKAFNSSNWNISHKRSMYIEICMQYAH